MATVLCGSMAVGQPVRPVVALQCSDAAGYWPEAGHPSLESALGRVREQWLEDTVGPDMVWVVRCGRTGVVIATAVFDLVDGGRVTFTDGTAE